VSLVDDLLEGFKRYIKEFYKDGQNKADYG
jgi:hypothetical protein